MAKSPALKKSASKKSASQNPVLVPLTPEEVRHTLKPIAGFAAQIEPVLKFYAANEDALRIEGLDVDKIRASLAAYQALVEPIQETQAKLAELQESALFYGSDAYSGFLEIYARAQAVARVNHAVARGLVPFANALKKPRKKKGGTPPTSST